MKPSKCERRFLLMWILDECQLRWPETTKRDVWEAYKEVTNDDIQSAGIETGFGASE
jgi:hypothetical protein